MDNLLEICHGNFLYLGYFQIGGILIVFAKIHQNVEEIKIIINYSWDIDKIFEKTKVYEGLQYSCKQKSVALLVKDLEI